LSVAVVEVSNLVEVIPPPVGELAVGIAAGEQRVGQLAA
jgi:hypothetical protein